MQLYRFPFKAMGTPCELQFYSERKLPAKKLARLVMSDIYRIENKYSRYKQDSFLSEINRIGSHGGQIAIDAETASLLRYADTCFRQSDGLFDVTSGILRKAWDYKEDSIPSEQQIQDLVARIGWESINFDAQRLRFNKSGMELDFGGIAKEYAVDRAAVICLEQGINHGLVDLGGDIRIIGPRIDGLPWKVGVRHPREKGAMATLEVAEGAIASSGDYERCIIKNGRRYGHVLNPRTGWPVEDSLIGITVVAEMCVVAGSACTIAMLKGNAGKQWIEELGLAYVWMDSKGNIKQAVQSESKDT